MAPRRLSSILVSLAALAIAGCNTVPVQRATGKLRVIEVGPRMVSCQGLVPMQCLRVRDAGTSEWQLHYFGIQGFTFAPGKLCRLRIREEVVRDPPADAPGIIWILERVERCSPSTD